VFGDPFTTGQGEVGGRAVNAFLAGHLTVTTPSLTIPDPSFPQDTLSTLVLPFTFSGHIAGYDGLRDGPHEPPTRLFDAALFGSGSAGLTCWAPSLKA
jgi:hypothetical protein